MLMSQRNANSENLRDIYTFYALYKSEVQVLICKERLASLLLWGVHAPSHFAIGMFF